MNIIKHNLYLKLADEQLVPRKIYYKLGEKVTFEDGSQLGQILLIEHAALMLLDMQMHTAHSGE